MLLLGRGASLRLGLPSNSLLDQSLLPAAQKTYALLVRLHDHYGMHEIFSPGFPGMLEAFYVQERLIESMMPEVYATLVGR